MKAVVAAFNQEEALVGAFSVIVQPVVEPMDRFAALMKMPQLGLHPVTTRLADLVTRASVPPSMGQRAPEPE